MTGFELEKLTKLEPLKGELIRATESMKTTDQKAEKSGIMKKDQQSEGIQHLEKRIYQI